VSADDDGGCGCRVPAQPSSNTGLALFGLLAALGVAARRRRR
jgi:MYXO-CTERM domain-containing protein